MDGENINLEDLKNPNNLDAEVPLSVSFEIDEYETAIEYKKSLNKKVSQFTDEEKAHYNKLAQKQKRKNDKTEEEKKEIIDKENLDEEKKTNLYNQLFVLKQKFPENTTEILINKDMNYKTLSGKKDLILQIITQKNSHNVVFETLLLMCRTGERGMNYMDMNLLDGYTENVEEQKDDIIPILKEMIDLGEIDTSMLTPHLRLMIVMSSIGVKTMEKNNDKKKSAIPMRDLERGGVGEEGQ